MKAFIDKVFKKRKKDAEQAEEQSIEQPVEQIEQVKKEASRASIETINLEKVAKPNHFPDCKCFKCERWKQQNA
jgi:hypothetical protein